MEIGAYTFGDVAVEGEGADPSTRLPELVEEIVLADEVGLDVFGIGEHHRRDFAAPNPAVLLAAAASRTNRIRLTSAVTVLSSDDPVRVFEEFAMLDLLSGGRAEIMAGRGALTESFRIFGYDLGEYDELFAEKLELLLELRGRERITWSGKHRAPLEDQLIFPRPVQNPLPVWLAVGGSPNSVVRAGELGLPLALAMLGGHPAGLAPMFNLHREALAHFGHGPQPAAITVHGFVAETSQQAAEIYFPAETAVMNRIGGERGMRPQGWAEFNAKIAPNGALVVGSPQQVIEKILDQHEAFGHQRTLLQLSIGTVPHLDLMRAIELLGTEIAPVVRREVDRRTSRAAVA
jgi:probable LLM family oxidoreductase